MNIHIIIYSMYRDDALRRLRAGYPALLQWRGGTIFPGSRPAHDYHTAVLAIECFLTRSMLFLKLIYTLFTHLFPAQYQKRYDKLITPLLFFLWVLGMGYVILLWQSLSLPYCYSGMFYSSLATPHGRVQ